MSADTRTNQLNSQQRFARTMTEKIYNRLMDAYYEPRHPQGSFDVTPYDPYFQLAKAMAAIAMNESAWGKKQTGTNNFYGIKANDKEDGSMVTTHEVENGKNIKTDQKFKNYNTFDEGVNDFVDLLMGDKYQFGALTDLSGRNIARVLKKKGPYYTAPESQYAYNLHWIINGRTFRGALTGYDPTKSVSTTQDNSTLKFPDTQEDLITTKRFGGPILKRRLNTR